KETLFSHSALYRRIPDELKNRLHRFTKYFLTEVEFNGGLVGDFGEDEMVLVAGEACVLILGRDYWDYRKLSLVELRKFPILDNEEFTLPWEPNAHYAGHATINTVRLHWDTALLDSSEGASGNNLILHEFAHIMDYADDGTCQSILGKTGSEEAHQWEALLEEEFPKLVEAHKRGEDHVLPPYTIKLAPSHVTMRGIKVQRPEFFSCATEVFFEKSERLQNECPKIYEAMKAFYRLDPAEW
ncbi:MAG: zinc-dependent peptidase, partial [Verrucomicrobiota bacterium]|nr:zinc-dependent peptidase [Verrucomicrobiota bacterium]